MPTPLTLDALAQQLAGRHLRADAIPANPFNGLAERMVAQGMTRMDGAPMRREDAIHFQRELEHLSATVHLIQFQDLTHETAFPLAPDQPPPGAESYAWPEVELLAAGSSGTGYQSLGGAGEFTRAKNTSPLRVYTSHYGFDVGDQQRSQLHGLPLSTYKAEAAKRIIAQDMNSDCWNGNAKLNIPGLLSNASVVKTATANGAAGTKPWSTKTADEIENDLLTELKAFVTAVKGKLELYPNTLALPSSRFSYIAATRRASGTDTTLLTYLRETMKAATQQPNFEITSHPELENGGTPVSSKPYFIWHRKDPKIAGRVMALSFSELAAQIHGFQTLVPCHAQGGGLVVFKPVAIRIGYDI